MTLKRSAPAPALAVACAAFVCDAAPACGQADLAAAVQNPIAAMVSLPFQNNTFFRTGPDNDTAKVLDIQPVVPISLGDWNVITRTIISLFFLPSVTDSLPDRPSADTSGDHVGLGGINVSAYVSRASKGSLTWGVGPSLTLRTATSDRDRDNATMLPVGGGLGRVFSVGGQALNAQVQGLYNALRPDFAPEASLRRQLTFLFPK